MFVSSFDREWICVKGSLFSCWQGASYLKSVEFYDSESNSWKINGGMNYRRLGGGVGVIKLQQYDSILYGTNSASGSASASPDDIKNRSLSKLVDLWMTPISICLTGHVQTTDVCSLPFLSMIDVFFFSEKDEVPSARRLIQCEGKGNRHRQKSLLLFVRLSRFFFRW